MYTVTTAAPVVNSLSVISGFNTNPVTISVGGSGFFGGVGSNTVTLVKLGTLPLAAGYAVPNDSTITGVIIPSGVYPGTYDIAVAALGGMSVTVAADKFTVKAPLPTVNSLSVSAGFNSSPVTITVGGSGFFGGVGSNTVTSVKLNTTTIVASYIVSSDSSITGVIIPAGLSPASYNINLMVTALGGTSVTTSSNAYTVKAAQVTVTGLSVSSGSNLAPVTISVYGGGFFGGVGSNTVTAIKLGTYALGLVSASNDSTIPGVRIPAGTTPGTYDVTVTALGGTSTTVLGDQYTVTTPAPVVSGVTPNSGSTLTANTVTVTGSGFFGGVGSNTVSSVKLGTLSLVFSSVSNDSTITRVIVPASIPIGIFDVQVTALGGTSITSTADNYTVLAPAVVVSSLSVTTGSNLVPVTLNIVGSGFFGSVGSNTVTAVKLGTNTLSGYTTTSDSAINGVVVPSGIQIGVFNILVTALGGTSATAVANKYTVTTPPPTITLLSKYSGPAGTIVDITGANFFAGTGTGQVTSVFMGTHSITNYTVTSDSSITGAIIPVGVPLGTWYIVAKTTGATSASTAASLFTVTAPIPTVSNLSLSTSSNLVTRTITVTGSGFFGGGSSNAVTAVNLGATLLTGYAAANDSTLTGVRIPTGIPVGVYDLTVTALGGTSATTSSDVFTVTTSVPVISRLSITTGTN